MASASEVETSLKAMSLSHTSSNAGAEKPSMSECDDFISCVSKAKVLVKREQESIHKEATCSELDRGLDILRRLIADQEVWKRTKLVQGELFMSIETLINLCIDDGGNARVVGVCAYGFDPLCLCLSFSVYRKHVLFQVSTRKTQTID
jgi:hypothetical protein